MTGFVVAVDGPAASGKGTIAGRLAADYRLPFLDTGLLYRAVGLAVREAGGDPGDPEAAQDAARQLDPATLMPSRLGGRAAGEAASQVAAHPGVRAALLKLQQEFAAQPGGAVLDGRDIGTVVCPEAEVKLYVTASPEARAGRRHAEQVAAGQESSLEGTLAEVRARDARDAGRAVAPLRPAEDAVVIDTSGMSVEEAVAVALGVVRARLGLAGGAAPRAARSPRDI